MEFESPVDCNSSQTRCIQIAPLVLFESPVDCNSSQTRSQDNDLHACLRAL